jgi:hypothetical protein
MSIPLRQQHRGDQGFIKSRPAAGRAGRRSMPQFNLSEEELEALASS